MDQIHHILRKDVRRLWREIVAVTIVTLLLAWLHGDNRLILPVSRREQALYGLRNLLMPLNAGAWWFLILSLIHEEAIPGIHQFWLTRPYRRGALLGAKLLFIFLFVNLPVLLADAIALLRSGVPFEWTGILWKQVLFSAVVPLPAMAMAAVTAGLSQAILGMLGLSVLTALLAMIPGVEYGLPGGMGWWNAGAGLLSIVAAGPLLLYWQFHRRMTTHSRLLVLAVTVAFSLAALLLPWRTAFAWQQRLARQPGAGAGYTVQSALERGRLSPEGDMRPSAETA